MKKTFLYIGFACLGLVMGTVSSVAQVVNKTGNPSNKTGSVNKEPVMTKENTMNDQASKEEMKRATANASSSTQQATNASSGETSTEGKRTANKMEQKASTPELRKKTGVSSAPSK